MRLIKVLYLYAGERSVGEMCLGLSIIDPPPPPPPSPPSVIPGTHTPPPTFNVTHQLNMMIKYL